MQPTLDEITAYENRLRSEIVERECVLAAIKVLRTYTANSGWPQSMELGPLTARLLTPAPESPTTSAALPQRAQYVPPPPPPMNPELQRIYLSYGGDTAVVKWAIARMTDDYSLLDIAALLTREGYPMRAAKISVVLTRLKGRGEIVEIKRGSGPKPAVFRKPENPIPLVREPAAPTGDNESIEASETAA